METQKNISLKLIFWIIFWFLILGAGLVFAGFWGIENLKNLLSQYHQQGLSKDAVAALDWSMAQTKGYIWQLVTGSLAITALFLWLTLRASLKGAVGKTVLEKPQAAGVKRMEKPVAPPQISREEKEKAERLDKAGKLQMVSLLQRDGRLVDFLEEDLQSYEDAQIGAAVRTIQKSCQDTLNKYMKPSPIIDRNEGEEVAIEAGFDPAAIKLTGNVSGEPPFKGILQHRGWRAAKVDLPTLSGTQDPGIIAPAEVEI